ncbi:MAG: ParA family protein [Deltaproteobacteria bacterium]|nr:MAG: ParA family protein [Deltaproteobacteria bacterium]
MGRTIAVANQKGGVGKTTTTVNLGASLAAAERRVLVVDIDPQGNATSGLGISKAEVHAGLYEALAGEATLDEVIQKTELDFLDLVPATTDLAGANIELVQVEQREFRLRSVLSGVAARYDYVLIDCPPSLELLTVNALVAADTVLVPLQCEYYALEGISDLMTTLSLVRQNLNPDLKVEGILLTMFDARNNLSHQVREEVLRHFEGQVFEVVVPRNVRLSEAPSFGKPILLYDLASKGSQAYLALAEEILARDLAEGTPGAQGPDGGPLGPAAENAPGTGRGGGLAPGGPRQGEAGLGETEPLDAATPEVRS